MAQFVAIAADRLAALIEDPESVEQLFAADAAPAESIARLVNLGENMRQRIIEQGPQMLEKALAQFDPALREQLHARLGKLGVDASGLARGEGGEALLKMMMARAQGGFGAGQGAPASRAASISLDKAWHGIHYLLCGAVEPDSRLISKAILGGTEVGEDFSGYGEARYFTAADVAALSAELNRTNLEAEMTRRYDPAQMTKLKIYPNGWAGPDQQWLMDEFRKLRTFYADASSKGLAIVTCLV
ncbi:MAG TPA: DUF1877 family protein [Candidatus Binataceae bacterium]|nr:DUF1877 family protein [Candidatus Binataceae bacterium]